MATVAK